MNAPYLVDIKVVGTNRTGERLAALIGDTDLYVVTDTNGITFVTTDKGDAEDFKRRLRETYAPSSEMR